MKQVICTPPQWRPKKIPPSLPTYYRNADSTENALGYEAKTHYDNGESLKVFSLLYSTTMLN